MRSNWKTPFFYYKLKKKNSFKKNDKQTVYKVKDRNYRIFKFMANRRFEIYNGKKYKNVIVRRRMVGLTLGDLSHTRVRVHHLRRKREKMRAKKKKKNLKN